ncbi:MAG: UbiA family prenyltransferase [Bdellovibrionota bacterium]
MSSSQRVLVVDLDGTLIKTDMLLENFLSRFKANPTTAIYLAAHLIRSLAVMKTKLAANWNFDPALLPYCDEVINEIRKAKASGRKIVLATASAERIAKSIAAHLGLFDEVIASHLNANIKGKDKAAELTERFTESGFDYIGNSKADIPVWKQADTAYVVGASSCLLKKINKTHKNPKILDRQNNAKGIEIIKAIRAHQWVKNLLLFIPLLMAHKAGNLDLLKQVLIGFASFSLCASSVYVLNDLLDLPADRLHPRKRNRPFASGSLSLQAGIILAPLLLISGLVLTLFLPINFLLVLCGYFILTTFYSFWLKQIPLLDILLLAGLYTIRIFAGGVAAQVPVSHWLLLFSMFIFLSLACAKRVSEMYTLRQENLNKAAGRGYRASDLEQIASFGSSSGYISVLVLALYVTSRDIRRLYDNPEALWLLCPVILYWISRVWLITHRGELDDDPIVFAIKDKVSYLVGGSCILLMLLGT